MHYNIRSMLNGPHQIWGRKGVVYHKGDLMGVCNLCQPFNIHHIGIGISQSLHMNGLGILFNGRLYCLIVKGIHKRGGDPVFRQRMGKQVIGTSVNILCCHNMVPGVCQVLECIGNCGCSGCHCQSGRSALQGRDTLFKHILCGIGKTPINVSRIP